MESTPVTTTEVVQDEHIVATLPAPDTGIKILQERQNAENIAIANQAKALVIADEEQYQQAAEVAKDLQRRMKSVKDFFAPIKESANKAHKAACDSEKKMLAPLNEAATAVKKSMSDYVQEQERKRRAAEEEARRKAEEEAAKLLEQAVQAEQNGDTIAAAAALEEAEIMADAPAVAAPAIVKQEGVSYRTDWEVTITKEDDVPISIMGAVIRPVDLAAIKKMVRATKGKIQIPGISIRETKTTVIKG